MEKNLNDIKYCPHVDFQHARCYSLMSICRLVMLTCNSFMSILIYILSMLTCNLFMSTYNKEKITCTKGAEV